MRAAIESGDLAEVNAALEGGVDLERPFVDRDGYALILGERMAQRTPPLVAAVHRGDSAIVAALLRAGADVNARPEPRGDVALGATLGSRGWDARMLLTILAADPDPHLVPWRPPAKATAEGEGSYHLVPKIYKEWIQREWLERDLASRSSNACIEAARVGDIETLREGLRNGISADAADEDGWTALLWACSAESASPQAALLLLEAGADPNRASRWGWTPLMAAAHANDARILRMLLDRGADPDAVERTERTPVIHVAANYGSLALVEALLEHDADPTRADAHFTSVLYRAQHNRTEDKDRILELLERELARQPWPAEAAQIELVTQGFRPGGVWPAGAKVRTLQTGRRAEGVIWVSGNDVALAFDVVWIAEDGERVVGSLAAQPGSVRGFEYRAPIEGEPPAAVRIELRPSRDVALRELKTWRIWGEPIALGRVELR